MRSVVTGVELVVPGGEVSPFSAPRVLFFGLVGTDEEPACEIVWDVTASELVDTDVIYDFAFRGQSQNIWRWTLAQVRDTCVEPVVTADDREAIDAATALLNGEVYAAIGTATSVVPDSAGSFGFWSGDVLEPDAGVFIDTAALITSLAVAASWNGESPFVLPEEVIDTASEVPTLPADQAPGELLSNVFYTLPWFQNPL